MDVVAVNLNEVIDIISDNGRLEDIQLGIIFEEVGEEGNMLQAGMSHSNEGWGERHTSSVRGVVSKGRTVL